MTAEDEAKDPDKALSNFLDDILKHPSSGLTAQGLYSLSDDHLLQYSLLILALLGKLCSRDDDLYSTPLLDAFVARVATNRVLKLRIALLAGLNGLKQHWDTQLTFDSHCNEVANKRVLKLEDPAPLPKAFLSASRLLEDTNAFQDFVQTRFFHPQQGIHLKRKKRALGLRSIPNAFSEQYAICFLMQDLNVNKTVAEDLLSQMMAQELIKVAVKGNAFSSFTGLGNDIYVPASQNLEDIAARSRSPCRTDTSSTSPTRSDRSPSPSPHPSDVTHSGVTHTSYSQLVSVLLSLSMDALDLQSLKFWRDVLWEKPFVQGATLDSTTVVHPTTASGQLVHSIKVEKVFASMAHPAFLSLSAYQEGSLLHAQEIQPRVIAKNGDNLLNDASVELLFRVFTHIWKTDFESEQAPFAFDYDVLPCGPRLGLLGVLSGLEPLNDFDWDKWATAYAMDRRVKSQMCRSAAGCSIATFILGCGDRHWDNIQIQNHTTMLHIDFGMILGENPAFKTPRFSISSGQEAAFKKVGIWDDFVELSGQAYLTLRKRAPALMNLTTLVLQLAGRKQSQILKYLASKESFNLAQDDDVKAALRVTRQIRESSTHWETIARKFTHDRIDPVFFKVVEAAPQGLIAAVEKMYDKT